MSSFWRSSTRPWPRHVGHGCSTMRPSPWQRGQALTLTICPKMLCTLRRTWPLPPQSGHWAGLRARRRAAAAAVRAGSLARHLDGAAGAEHRLLEADVDGHAQVGARLRPALAATPAAAEEHVEEVEGGVEREAAEVGHAVGGVPEGVVALALLRVAQHRVRLADLLEALLGLLVALVAVGVELHGQLAIRLLQLGARRRSARRRAPRSSRA